MANSTLYQKTVCVFCSADDKVPVEYKQTAYELGHALATNGFALLSGGNNSGLMNAVNNGHADAVHDAPRFAVIPEIMRALAILHPRIPATNIVWSTDVYNRLQRFNELCDFLVILPGGYGTLHELMDCLVLSQFGLIKKHIFLYNIDGFWAGLLQQFKIMVEKKALCQKHLDHLIVVNSVADLIAGLQSEEQLILEQGFADEYWKEHNQ